MRGIGRILPLMGVALVVGAARADWESWQQSPGLFSVSLESYKAGDALSDTGAVNGTWGNPVTPTGAEAIIRDPTGGIKHVSVSTPDTAGIVFTPSEEGIRTLKSVLMTLQLMGYTTLPSLTDDVRAAIALSAPEDGERSFVGWGWSEAEQQFMWHRLHLASGNDSLKDGWRQVSLRFAKDLDGRVRVQYRVVPNLAEEEQAGKYEILLPTDSSATSSWFYCGGSSNTTIVGDVEFRGDGGFASLDGSEPKRGIASGIENWYGNIFDETVIKHGTGAWSDDPSVQGDDFVIAVDDASNPTTFVPAKQRDCSCVVTKIAARFMSASDDDACPESPCARVRLVEDAKEEGVYRFACLVNGAWVTNQAVQAYVSKPYTVEIGIDRQQKRISYRVKDGYGAEGGTNVVLSMDGVMETVTPGAVKSVEFSGSGYIREIRGQNKPVK